MRITKTGTGEREDGGDLGRAGTCAGQGRAEEMGNSRLRGQTQRGRRERTEEVNRQELSQRNREKER